MAKLPSLQSLVASVEKTAGAERSLDRVQAAAEIAAELNSLGDELIDHFVTEARESGSSWAQVGERLGVTKQAAQQRFTSPQRIFGRIVRASRRAKGQARQLWTRFTDKARRAVVNAQEEARDLGHNYIGTEHLLLGVLSERGSLGEKVLVEMGLSLEGARATVEQEVGRGDAPHAGPMPFTPRTKKVLELALREALALGHNYIGTEHLVLAIACKGEGLGAEIMQAQGVTYERLRGRLVALLAG